LDDDPLPLAPPVIPLGLVAGLVPPQYASPATFRLQYKTNMIENGFEFGIGLALAAFGVAICLGLACMLFVGVSTAVLLALARRSAHGGDDDARDDRHDYQHDVVAKKERANEDAAWRRRSWRVVE
jgi:hypothetical protein